MDISPYIEQTLRNPAAKVFYTAEDIIYDRRLTARDKQLLLKNSELLAGGLVHASRK